MKLIRYCSLIASIFLLTSCSYFLDRIPGVYSLDIQQGNMISQDVINQLRPNMSKRQVLFVMGSPMLKDIFHERRWDYLYSLQAGGNPRVQKKISLFFDGDKLIGVQGDYR
ncbi:MAG: outer membrane protein assembly factor BamE, partial [Methylococcales bacterium]